MFKRIMVPVDLQYVDRLQNSLEIAARLAREYNATVYYVTVAGSLANRAAKRPEELETKLQVFAREQGEMHGIATGSKMMRSTDIAVELDDRLVQAQRELDADLVVMASHIPGVADRLHLISSNAGELAKRLPVSVFILR